jgi:hypothetical protein
MNLIEWVDEILLQEWDPIGVRDIPQCADEYSSYAPEIADLVARKASPEIIAGKLNLIVSERMGSKPDVQNAYRVACILAGPLRGDEEI